MGGRNEIATFAAGCFWGVEEAFSMLPGVLETSVGYSGGTVPHPTYRQVCSGKTGHAEAVRVVYDPTVITYRHLLDRFFSIHDPTTVNRQGPNIGEQYRSAVFYHNPDQEREVRDAIRELEHSGRYRGPIVTEVSRAGSFYTAEEYHQQYFQKMRGVDVGSEPFRRAEE